MPRTRFIRTLEQIREAEAAYVAPTFTDIRSLAVTFDTDPEVLAELIPAPLAPGERPTVSVAIGNVRRSNCVGPFMSCVVNLPCTYQGAPGVYALTMPMSTDTAVLFGRELFAEPKKLAAIRLDETATENGRIEAVGRCTRHGITYIEIGGRFAGPPEPVDQPLIGHNYFVKYLPAADGRGLAFNPQLIRVTHRITIHQQVAGEVSVTFRESVHDPIIDVPVQSVGTARLAELQTITSAEVVETIPAQRFLPYAHARNDRLEVWSAGPVSSA
jgi:acetoacetate decarboxylase